MSLLDILTGGESGEASSDEQAALQALAGVQTPTAAQLSLPELQQYAVSQNMTPAQMQAFLQQNNALATENTPQTGTAAQIAALNQLGTVANAGATGTPVEQAQIAQALQQSNTNLNGQRGAIDQQAEARGVAPGLLQAALSQQNAGQDAQNANQAALQAQSQAYQTALNAMTQGAGVGNSLQGQQNTQANTVAQAQNAMQQFNAANQQAASANNAQFQQGANQYNTQEANQVGQQNTGLANQRTQYNAQVPQTVYQDQLSKAQAQAGEENQAANTATNQGQQQAGLIGGLIGAGSTLATGSPAASSGALTGTQAIASGAGSTPSGANANPAQYGIPTYAHGGEIPCLCDGGMCMKHGGQVPGKAKVPGDSSVNDTVDAKLSPGEVVVPRSRVQQDPLAAMRALTGRPASTPMPGEPLPGQPMPPQGHNPQDIAALLQAMKHLRGSK